MLINRPTAAGRKALSGFLCVYDVNAYHGATGLKVAKAARLWNFEFPSD